MRNAGLEEAQAGIKIARRNISNLRYADDTTLMAECEPVLPKGDQSWIFIGRTDSEAETPILWPPHWKNRSFHLKRSWCWERLKAGGEGNNRGWDGWMASLTQWTWVWVNSRSWRWTGRSGMLQSMGLQRLRHDWATELNEPRKTVCLNAMIQLLSLLHPQKTKTKTESQTVNGTLLENSDPLVRQTKLLKFSSSLWYF